LPIYLDAQNFAGSWVALAFLDFCNHNGSYWVVLDLDASYKTENGKGRRGTYQQKSFSKAYNVLTG
jgi:hypothetical protein